jgi:hypothetical protein
MPRYFFVFIISIHGFIHFVGFAKAFDYGDISHFVKEISKTAGLLWLQTAVFFIIATILYLLKKDAWPVIAIIAVILSQFLIINSWQDAKLGTIANAIILLVAIVGYGDRNFTKKVNKEISLLLSEVVTDKKRVTKEKLAGLPPGVQKWMERSGILGKEMIHTVRLKQKGKLRTKPGGNWMNFEAKQYFNVDHPAFIWQTKVRMLPPVFMSGRDKFSNAKGEMLIKLLSLKNVVNAGGDKKMNEAAMIRFLAETCWFPSAALTEYIKWESINKFSSKATMTYKDITVSGIFNFSESGDIKGFEALRYYGNDEKASLEKWIIEVQDYKDFGGIRIPYNSKVIWKLKDGDFTWMNVELIDLEYNHAKMYR